MSQQINLFDAALQKQYDPWVAKNVGLILLALLVIGAAWGGWAHQHKAALTQELAALTPQLEQNQASLKQLNEQLLNLKPDARLLQELNDAKARLTARTEVLQILKKGLAPETASQADWLRGFARQIPNGLWLTAFNINTDTNALNIHGRTTDPALIAEYMRRLSAEKAFRGRTFAALEIAKTLVSNEVAPTNTAIPLLAQVGLTLPPPPPASISKPAPAARFHEFELISTEAASAPNVAKGAQP